MCIQAFLETFEDVAQELPAWTEHDNHEAPHSAFHMRSPAECHLEWVVKTKNLSVQNLGGAQEILLTISQDREVRDI